MARILVVDDEETVRFLVASYLQKLGHTVDHAGDGEAGLSAYRLFHPDLVITDILMPGGNGLDLIDALVKEVTDVGIVAMSAEPAQLRAARRTGAHATLAKPFTHGRLSALIDEILERKTNGVE